MYNLTGIADNTTGIVTFMQGVNTHIMQGLLGILFLIMIGSVTFLGFYYATREVKHSFVGMSFVSLLASLPLLAMNLIPGIAFFVILIFVAASLALPNST